VNGEATPRVNGEQALDALRVIWEIEEKLGFLDKSQTISVESVA
jgi:hypothetical protein